MALIKAGFVILAPGHEPLRTSARNALPGLVVEHREGAVNDEVVLEHAGGARITATVSRVARKGPRRFTAIIRSQKEAVVSSRKLRS